MNSFSRIVTFQLFQETHSIDEYNAVMYKGIIAVSPYIDVDSQDMLDVQAIYKENKMLVSYF